MKNKVFAVASVLVFTLIISSCAVLPTNPKSLNILIPLAPNKKLTVNLLDKSAFNVDIENPTNDTLIIKGANNDQAVVNNKITLSVLPGNNVEILNVSKSNIKPVIRVYNHKAKVITKVSEIK
ncbi:hypothetical protein DU508_20250 [Pedobacter chinensis]|uniref:Auto-transporter adhesin head GIN domain-containing protein n=1 Tax=Pedobacter chinensis TaxID=2282421 RepID=A0A369PRE3_9SPHI|nr:hypothetical protein [Pedobacter chinensis]RDC54830.1 hypothetical protein DU508_20250 [Pedobacter chinensis]